MDNYQRIDAPQGPQLMRESGEYTAIVACLLGSWGYTVWGRDGVVVGGVRGFKIDARRACEMADEMLDDLASY